MSRVRLTNKHALLGKLGSFWGQSLTPESLKIARRLSHFVDHTSTLGDMQSIVSHAAAEGRLPFEHKTLSFQPSDVVVLDESLQTRLRFRFGTDENSGYSILRIPQTSLTQEGWTGLLEEFGDSIVVSETDALILFPDSSSGAFFKMDSTKPIYTLLVAPDIYFESIDQDGRLMLCGVDFFQQGSLLVFHERPDTLFPDLRILVRSGFTEKPCLFNYSLSLNDVKGDFSPITGYLAGNLSAKSFERAIAVAAGLTVASENFTVLSVSEGVGSSRTYSTTSGMITVDYLHDPLLVGQTVYKGDVIGGAVRVLSLENSSGAWWRETNWDAGLNLDPVCQVKGLVAPDAMILFDAVEQSGLNIHARPHFHGERSALEQLWAQIKQNESKVSKFLNYLVSLESVSDKKYLNAIDFLFSNLFGKKSIVVELKTRRLGDYYHNRAIAFIQREKPVNVVTLINEV